MTIELIIQLLFLFLEDLKLTYHQPGCRKAIKSTTHTHLNSIYKQHRVLRALLAIPKITAYQALAYSTPWTHIPQPRQVSQSTKKCKLQLDPPHHRLFKVHSREEGRRLLVLQSTMHALATTTRNWCVWELCKILACLDLLGSLDLDVGGFQERGRGGRGWYRVRHDVRFLAEGSAGYVWVFRRRLW